MLPQLIAAHEGELARQASEFEAQLEVAKEQLESAETELESAVSPPFNSPEQGPPASPGDLQSLLAALTAQEEIASEQAAALREKEAVLTEQRRLVAESGLALAEAEAEHAAVVWRQ